MVPAAVHCVNRAEAFCVQAVHRLNPGHGLGLASPGERPLQTDTPGPLSMSADTQGYAVDTEEVDTGKEVLKGALEPGNGGGME